MFKSKRSLRFWIVLAALCFLLGFCFDFGSSGFKPGVTKSNCDSIQVGMSEKEVDVILGGPATRVSSGVHDSVIKEWIGQGCFVTIFFADDQVLLPPFYNEYEKPTLLDRALKSLGLRSKKNLQAKP
jgi:hypothetical protein